MPSLLPLRCCSALPPGHRDAAQRGLCGGDGGHGSARSAAAVRARRARPQPTERRSEGRWRAHSGGHKQKPAVSVGGDLILPGAWLAGSPSAPTGAVPLCLHVCPRPLVLIRWLAFGCACLLLRWQVMRSVLGSSAPLQAARPTNDSDLVRRIAALNQVFAASARSRARPTTPLVEVLFNRRLQRALHRQLLFSSG